MIIKIKNDIFNKKNKFYKFKINNIRNKSEIICGCICEVYDKVFVIKTIDGINHSFAYSDVLTGVIEIQDEISITNF